MNFIIIFISYFLTNYFFYRIMNLLPIKSKKIITIALIAVSNISQVVISIVNMVKSIELANISGALNSDLIYIFMSYAIEIFGILFAFLAITMIMFGRIRFFKKRRLKEFERNYKGVKQSQVLKFALPILFGILFCGSVYFSIWFFINYKGVWDIIDAIILLGIASLCLFFIYKSFAHQKETKYKELFFFIKYQTNYFTYLDKPNKEKNYQDMLGDLEKEYIFTQYGYLVEENKKYKVIGIQVDHFSQEILQRVHMNPVASTIYEKALNEFSTYNKKKVSINNQGEVLSVKSIR